MSAEQPDRLWSKIDIVKLAAGTLAAVSAAFCASFLGVAGTLIGAGIASIVATVGQELYSHSLSRSYRRLRRLRGEQLVAAAVAHPPPAAGAEAAGPASDAAGPADRGGEAAANAPSSPAGSTAVTAAQPVAGRRPVRRWAVLVAGALAVFTLAMVAVTGLELLTGRPLAAMFGNETAGRTTVGTVGGGAATTPDSTPSVGPSRSATPDARTGSPSPAPTSSPTPGLPTDTGPTTGSTGDPQTTTGGPPAPTTVAPAPTRQAPTPGS